MPHKNLANVANARPKGCLWQPDSKQNMKEHDRTSSKPESSFAAELSGNPGDGGNPVEDSAVTFTEKNNQSQPWQPTHVVTETVTNFLFLNYLNGWISSTFFNIIKARNKAKQMTETVLQGPSTSLVKPSMKPSRQRTSSTTCINKYQHPSTCNRIYAILLPESASAVGRALPGHCIPLGVEVSFGKGLSWTAATETQI